MPIRFRCAYCNQLMGISRRKIGTVVRCPKCSGQVVVPHAEPDAAKEPGSNPNHPAVRALEDPELDALLAGATREAAGVPKPKPKRPIPQAIVEIDVEPLEIPPPMPIAVPPALEPIPVSTMQSTLPSPVTSSNPTAPPSGSTLMSKMSQTVTIALPLWAFGAASIGVVLAIVLAGLVGYWLGH